MKKEKLLMKEIEELWDMGYAEALAYWGNRCVKDYIRGYNIGFAVGLVTISVATIWISKMRKKK